MSLAESYAVHALVEQLVRASITPPLPAADVDATHMRSALALARNAMGDTRPNPLVGSRVVSDGEVVGEGFHRQSGAAHAETPALDAAGERARGSTLYVTLEPCSHHGQTPPCAERVISAGVSRVVLATIDPDTRVNGEGIRRLRAAGVVVDIGCLAEEAIGMNLGYLRDRLGDGPTITLKMATSLDGKIARAPGRRDAVTGEAALDAVHRMRADNDCVVVGVDTVLVDQPRLDCRRLGDRRTPPVPVVLDTTLRLPVENYWARAGQPYVMVCGADSASEERRGAHERAGARVLAADVVDGRVAMQAAVAQLARLGLTRIFVEGGAAVFSSFIEADAWHAIHLFQSGELFGDAGVPLYTGAQVQSLEAIRLEERRLGNDTLHQFLHRPTADGLIHRLAAK